MRECEQGYLGCLLYSSAFAFNIHLNESKQATVLLPKASREAALHPATANQVGAIDSIQRQLNALVVHFQSDSMQEATCICTDLCSNFQSPTAMALNRLPGKDNLYVGG